MKRVELDAVETPPIVTTVTSMVPGKPGGAVAEMEVLDETVKGAGIPPNRTVLTSIKLVPVIVTGVPPDVLPLLWLRLETVGADSVI